MLGTRLLAGMQGGLLITGFAHVGRVLVDRGQPNLGNCRREAEDDLAEDPGRQGRAWEDPWISGWLGMVANYPRPVSGL